MYEVIYEIERFPFPTDLITDLILLIGFFSFACIYFAEAIEMTRKIKRLSIKSIGKIGVGAFFSIVSIVIFLMFMDDFTYGGSGDYKFAKKYYKGEYEVVTGRVENFIPKFSDADHEHLEEFSIKDIHFEYGHAYKIGFQNIGDVIYKNGQNVKVFYIEEYDGNDIMNVIVKIEELKME